MTEINNERLTTGNCAGIPLTIDYLKKVGNASGEKHIEVSTEEQKIYLGNYKYGDGENEEFTITINRRKFLSLGLIGEFVGALYKIGDNKFINNGAPSVEITFDIQDGKVHSMTILDPDVTIKATKVA